MPFDFDETHRSRILYRCEATTTRRITTMGQHCSLIGKTGDGGRFGAISTHLESKGGLT
jgi:hypothetical protein